MKTPKLPTPMTTENRAGLDHLSRRVGVHGAFKASMIRGLSSRHRPGLMPLGARADEDWSIGFMDAWAGVCDVLAFYNERIGDEHYLPTATERFSVDQMARLVGYELGPASAAEVYVAFEADPMNIAQTVLDFNAGLAIKSVPPDGELPQHFETVDPLRLKVEWNAMRPVTQVAQTPSAGMGGMWAGRDTAPVRVGQKVVMMNRYGYPETPDKVRFLRSIVTIGDQTDGDGSTEPLRWVAFETGAVPTKAGIRVLPEAPQNMEIAAGDLVAELSRYRWGRHRVLTYARAQEIDLGQVNTALQEAEVAQINAVQPHVMGIKARLFGHNVVTWRGAEQAKLDATPGFATDVVGDLIPQATNPPANMRYVYLDQAYEGVVAGSVVVLAMEIGQKSAEKVLGTGVRPEVWANVEAVDVVSVEAYGISAEVTRLTLPEWCNSPVGVQRLSLAMVRGSVVYAGAQPLALPRVPVESAVGGDVSATSAQLVLDAADLDLAPGQDVIISGERIDLPGVAASERVRLSEVEISGTNGVLTFEGPLAHAYDRKTVQITANVARATHGETVVEVVGSGSATRVFQQFVLRDGPLTYVSAQTATGRLAALNVSVDGVRWHPVPTLAQAGPTDRVYRIRTLNSGQTRIEFGDGITGARLPTGENNIEATYRKGSGAEGRVAAGQLSLLVNKPRAIKSAINPLAAEGGSAAEHIEDARANAPTASMTLGRIVSLRDYEDFARGFAGISKAVAGWSWAGETRVAYVTIAGEDATPVPLATGVGMNLIRAITEASVPDVAVRVLNAQVVPFGVRARIKINPDFVPLGGTVDPVMDAVRRTLRAHFAYARRGLGAPVRASDVIAVIQSVAGVDAVDLDALHRMDTPVGLAQILRAERPRNGTRGTVQGMELLVLSADPIALEVL